MTSVLLLSSDGPGAPPVQEDLASTGFQVLAVVHCTNLLQAVIKEAPDLVVVFDDSPDRALFSGTAAVAATAPCPVIVFTTDPDAEKIALSTRSGVHAYVVNGYSQNRLRSVIHLAQARFRQERSIQDELTEVTQRFAERKLVDRARGILMGARQLREEEAYRALRSAAMHGKQRIGQVAQRVIESARYAEAINRAGQLRMLSQRLAKLYAQTCAGVRPDETKGLLADSIGHVESNLATLGRTLSAATFGDLLEAVLAPWKRLHAVLAAPAVAARLAEMDREAEQMLLRAEQLTANLEIAGFAAALHVINVAGRQRMLSQRMAKQALLTTLLPAKAATTTSSAMVATQAELVEGLAYLHALPMSNPDISRELSLATDTWTALLAAMADPGAQDRIANASEALLAHFERLTDELERGMQRLV